MSTLAQDIRKLARKAYPGFAEKALEGISRDAFCDALDNQGMVWYILTKAAPTMEGALRAAVQYEAFDTAHNNKKNGTDFRVRTIQTETERATNGGPN